MLVGYAPGVYDLFHIGHLTILRRAAERCDRLIAGVVSDEMASAAKGRLPVTPLAERAEIVGALDCVDAVHIEEVPSKLAAWCATGFDVIFKGDDWRGTPKGDALERQLAVVGVEVVYLPYTAHTSSTLLRAALTELAAGHVRPLPPRSA
ncbi:adenylyltransferase/cytidyltransferase family protein [Pseudonocardia sp. ICBG1142]|uniref:adenylyltransferase/cytidyltransferase family protein n=1 Tax=Pseudonocardia sp. ICBG1142 TaxID=2846760 RepID=UPI001CF62780|nr:adenylyltransferase/cytidyltransferase family protein [Pseudonocardia sp. ICBG1142]